MMTNTRFLPLARLIAVVVASTSLEACRRVDTTARADFHESRRAELLRQDRGAEAVARSGDFIGALSGLFAAQGVLLAPVPQLSRGPAAARATLERDTLNARSSARWTVLRHDVSSDGRDGYTYGYIDLVRPSGETVEGRYHAYWRRSDEGRWQILAMTRARRPGGMPTSALPPHVAPHATRYARGPMRDTILGLKALYAMEAEFSDSVGANVGRAFGHFAASDAAKVSGATYVFGRSAIEGIFGDPPPGALGPAWTPEAGAIAASDDLGFTYGPAWPRVAGRAQQPPAVTTGRYFSIWRRQPDGTWRYVVD